MDSPLSARLEPGRALVALQWEWITPEQFREILHCDPEDGPQLERLQREGVIPAERLAEVYGSTVLLAPKAAIERLGEAFIKATASGEALKKGDWIAARYHILDSLNGAFGRVYVCEAKTGGAYRRGDTRVALKTPLRQHLIGPGALDAFHTEAAQWIALGAHPNIVLAYGVEEHLRLPFLVMEYVEGARSLHHEIQAGRMNWLRALWVAVDVARGLAYAERRLGLVHGDLKPSNLLITREGSVKVADFGLSLCPGLGSDAEADALAGTFGYVAPEMYLEAPRRTSQTDVYAFGATLYEAVTGRRPFPDDQPWLNRVRDPPDPRRTVPSLPDLFADLILACLQRDPEARPAGFQELVPALEAMHLRLQGTPPPPSSEPDTPAQVDALANLAGSWLNLGRLEKAEDATKKALRLDPAHWKAHCALGNARMRRGDFPGALACFESAHRSAPEEVIPIVNAALAAREAGDDRRTSAWLDQSVRRCREMGCYAELNAISLLLVERLPADEALDLIDRILAEDPAAVMTWNNRAILFRRQGCPDEALASAERALAINPIYAKAWSNRATALVELGRFSEGLESAGRALELDPRLAGAYTAKATALAQLDRLPEARACLRNGLQILPGHPLLIRAEQAFG
jgi:serine/threonine protein kinase